MYADGNKKLPQLEGAKCCNHGCGFEACYRSKSKKKNKVPTKIVLSYRTFMSIMETGMITNLDTFSKGL